ncbi:DUF6004 family protein [Nonomuraea sp. KM90]|uniref:DUF6004 family protein n=1 Tax=Nonomuraea sp. KM90 TaxID=3457428 RepID=UPI003FCDFA02
MPAMSGHDGVVCTLSELAPSRPLFGPGKHDAGAGVRVQLTRLAVAGHCEAPGAPTYLLTSPRSEAKL